MTRGTQKITIRQDSHGTATSVNGKEDEYNKEDRIFYSRSTNSCYNYYETIGRSQQNMNTIIDHIIIICVVQCSTWGQIVCLPHHHYIKVKS